MSPLETLTRRCGAALEHDEPRGQRRVSRETGVSVELVLPGATRLVSWWWQGADLALEHEHGVLTAESLAEGRKGRDADRRALLELLHREGVLPRHVREPSYDELFGATHALLGKTRALLVLSQLDDVLREQRPVNMPSTQRYPNWRRRYPRPVEQLSAEPLLSVVAAAIGGQRAS